MPYSTRWCVKHMCVWEPFMCGHHKFQPAVPLRRPRQRESIALPAVRLPPEGGPSRVRRRRCRRPGKRPRAAVTPSTTRVAAGVDSVGVKPAVVDAPAILGRKTASGHCPDLAEMGGGSPARASSRNRRPDRPEQRGEPRQRFDPPASGAVFVSGDLVRAARARRVPSHRHRRPSYHPHVLTAVKAAALPRRPRPRRLRP